MVWSVWAASSRSVIGRTSTIPSDRPGNAQRRPRRIRSPDMRTFVAVLALLAASAAPALTQPAQRCSRDAFPVAGQAVAVTVCAGAPDGAKTVAVTETFKNATASFNHSTSIEVLPGAAVSRAVDDISLAPLGL